MPLWTVKDNVYPIRIFKQLEDDPINNILDAISKVSNEDQITILMSLRPYKEKFNKKAKLIADKLFKREIQYDQSVKWRKIITSPINSLVN
jgi:hypothetical protein